MRLLSKTGGAFLFRIWFTLPTARLDIPCFSVVSHFGGRTFAVYKAKSGKEFPKAYDLQKQQRVEAFGEADYSDDSHTAMWITKAVEDIAERRPSTP